MDVKAATSVSVSQQPQSGIGSIGDLIVGGKGQTAGTVPWIIAGVVILVLGIAAVMLYKRRGR